VKIPSISNERELLLRLQDSDQNAFRAIYELYAPRLAAKLFQLLRSEELAQDLLQDIFIKIWEMRQNIDPDLSFAGLLYKMAANLSKNAYRKSMYDKVLYDTIEQDLGYNPIEDSLNRSDAKALLESALNTLTPRQKEVYVMHKLEGRSYQEIASLLKISSSAINHHIQEAGKKLKVALKNQYLELLILLIPTFLKK
jgi:RNA polymerase sigma-70 factor (ECF subfamily)